jgi:hypothetical protein
LSRRRDPSPGAGSAADGDRAIPNSDVASGTCENISQPPSIAKAICT